MSGPIPEGIGKWNFMTELFLSYNRFTGVIPDMFGNMTEVTRM